LGRIGYRGQMLVEQHDDEGRAVNALMEERHAAAIAPDAAGYR
jgi:predicted DNA-binding WGR domain protein